MSRQTVRLAVNGVAMELDVEDRWTTADFLRDAVGLSGINVGCETGHCGACTVLIDGLTARSCLLYAGQLDGRDITTIEGLRDDALAADLRAALSTRHALQCGFCSPGVLMVCREIIEERVQLDAELIRERLNAALCRCTGYAGIVAAVTDLLAAEPSDRDPRHDGTED